MISADLGQQLEQFVANLVATGRYNSKSEVLREGVRLIHDRETHLAALDASIARGMADADAGRSAPADEAFDRLEAKYRAMDAGPTSLAQLSAFILRLERSSIHYTLTSVREGAIMVQVAVPGGRWEIEFFPDRAPDVEIFRSDGTIEDVDLIESLFSDYGD